MYILLIHACIDCRGDNNSSEETWRLPAKRRILLQELSSDKEQTTLNYVNTVDAFPLTQCTACRSLNCNVSHDARLLGKKLVELFLRIRGVSLEMEARCAWAKAKCCNGLLLFPSIDASRWCLLQEMLQGRALKT